jgi:chromate transporter
MNILLQLLLTFGLLSLLSIGGANATLPEIHRQVVDQLHWMDDATFVNLVAIGQAAPGPNVLIVSLIGWQAAGLAGLLAATLAIILPSSTLAIAVSRFMTRHEARESVVLVRRALAPVAIGLMLASGFVMMKAAYAGALTLVIAGATCATVYFTKASPLWGIAAGAILGIAAHRFGSLF